MGIGHGLGVQSRVVRMPIDLVECVLVAAQCGMKIKRCVAQIVHVFPKNSVGVWVAKKSVL